MNVHAATIPDTEEAWDERTLGADEKFVEVVDQAEEELINEAAGTQLISIRMSKCMIDDFKMIASLNGSIGYQTLMKQILQRFVDSSVGGIACLEQLLGSGPIADTQRVTVVTKILDTDLRRPRLADTTVGRDGSAYERNRLHRISVITDVDRHLDNTVGE